MILVDTGPFVALFDPKDSQHGHCRQILERIREPLTTTLPILTEAFHILEPASHGSLRLREFVLRGESLSGSWMSPPSRGALS